MGKRRAGLAALLLVGLGGQALADPLTDSLGDGPLCRSRAYDAAHLAANPGQKTRAVRLSLAADRSINGATLRAELTMAGGTRYIVADCSFDRRAGLDSMGKQLLESFKPGPGLDCHALTSADGASAEEGGDFIVDFKDGRSMTLHLPDEIAVWNTMDRSRPARFAAFGKDDRAFRVDQTATAVCNDLVTRLPALHTQAPAKPANPGSLTVTKPRS